MQNDVWDDRSRAITFRQIPLSCCFELFVFNPPLCFSNEAETIGFCFVVSKIKIKIERRLKNFLGYKILFRNLCSFCLEKICTFLTAYSNLRLWPTFCNGNREFANIWMEIPFFVLLKHVPSVFEKYQSFLLNATQKKTWKDIISLLTFVFRSLVRSSKNVELSSSQLYLKKVINVVEKLAGD